MTHLGGFSVVVFDLVVIIVAVVLQTGDAANVDHGLLGVGKRTVTVVPLIGSTGSIGGTRTISEHRKVDRLSDFGAYGSNVVRLFPNSASRHSMYSATSKN